MARSMIYQQGFDHGFALAVALLRGETGEACTIVIPAGISHRERYHFLEGVSDGIRNIAYSATLHIRTAMPKDSDGLDTGQMLCIYAKSVCTVLLQCRNGKNQKMLLA